MIKEVADCVFYEIEPDGTPGAPVLFLDTLKVSTIEQTAENVFAQGGKGNAKLIGWDFGKEISLELEDALFSPKSLAVTLGDGTVKTDDASIIKTITAQVDNNGNLPTTWVDANGVSRTIPQGTELKITSADGTALELGLLNAGDKVFLTFEVPVAGQTIVVSADTYPGTYYITGDTFARSEITGKDEYFQFIIPKGKLVSENTITLEAEGDPSVNKVLDMYLNAEVKAA